jgi:fimbrial chaperone protein
MVNRSLESRKAALCAAFLCFFLARAAAAGVVGISPLRLDLGMEQRAGVMQIMNTGAAPISMQVEAMEWQQSEDGQDHYQVTGDVIAVPAIFTIEPGETQMIRVGLVTAGTPDRERAYRLFYTELLPPLDENQVVGLRMRMRISIPVFASAPMAGIPELEYLGGVMEEDGFRATFRNNGNTHIRVQELAAMTSYGSEAYRYTAATYLLPGTRRDFLIDVSPDNEIARLVAITDTAGTQEYEVFTP